MYHPAMNEPGLEWLELYNQNAVDVDLGGWRLTGGIDYTFPDGTVIRGGGYLVVAVSPGALIAATGVTNVIGPFSGRLSNNGEELRLRDINNRLMDSLSYGVDGEWPAGADGGGVSLAKRHPNLASGLVENWTVSAQIGGTPGVVNFSSAPLLGPAATLVPIEATWRYDDFGTDLGTAWRAPGYSDSGWATGTGLFFVEDGPLPAPKSTPLNRDVNTYYFRGSFQIEGDPAAKVVSFRPVVDDGAVFYVNGAEVRRMNMPTGAVTFATMASAAVGDATFGGPFTIPSGNLVAGQNVMAVEVHQTTSTTNAGLRVIYAASFTAAWDGADGAFATPASPALTPANAALASLGVEAFSSSNTNLAANLNDGRYGNNSAWSPAAGDNNPYVVLRFNQTLALSSIAWSRDNGDTNDAGCTGGTCIDRALGNYTFQYTLHTNPAAITANNANPTNGWVTIATMQYLSTQPGFTPALRHRFDFAPTNGQPLLATGIRLRPANSNTLDEIEINPPTVSTFDAVFGLELTSRDILPPPPALAFNEISGASVTNFWLEIINHGDAPSDLTGVQIVRSGGSLAYTFPAQTFDPGGLVTLTQAQLGFTAALEDKLFLFTPGQQALLDAVTVRTNARGRFPDGRGDWLYPTATTPGASNVVALRSDIVINELMYHAPPFDPVPAVTSNFTLVPITGAWRYEDTGTDLGTGWREPGYIDSTWSSGAGLLIFNTGALPAPPGTTLAANRTTYYFRTGFNFSGATSNVTLDVRAVVDDGAVFYLNGTEIFRQNMPAGAMTYATSASSPVGDASYANPIVVPASSLVQGANVLAVEVHQVTSATTSSGIVLTGGGLTLVEEGPVSGSVPMNLARQPGVVPFVIDSLAGFPIHDYLHLNDGVYGNANSWIGNSGNPGYAGLRFGGQFTISSIAFGRDSTATYNDRTLGTYTLQYTRVAVPGTGTTVTQNPDTGWANIGTLNYQNAGTGLFANPSRRHRFTFTPVDATGIRLVVPGTGIGAGTCIDELEVNPPDTSGDIAFGAELSLTTTLAPALPYRSSSEEWVELFNRSTNAVDLTGWRLDAGIDFRFTNGPVIAPGGHVVVARDGAALRTKWPEIAENIVGDFSGRLQGGERFLLRDAVGNPVDETRVFEGGWSDGGGSSLERIDPRADALSAASWADSDETSGSVWQTVAYRMVAGQRFGNVLWNEFRLGLLDAGEVFVDDVSVVRDPDGARQQLVQNGDFEITTANTHWRMLGDHGASQIISEPGNAANHVLKVAASSPSRTSHNHIESTFLNNTALVDGQVYEVSYRARWLAGSPQVNSAAYFQKLARTTLLTVPTRHGTPGAANSRRVPNAGPALTALKHSPVIPRTNEAVTISVRARDPDGVASAMLNYRVNPAATFNSLSMTQQLDGSWSANIPGQTAGKIVQFYVSAQDVPGAVAFAPAQGPASRALFQVADTQTNRFAAHELRLIQLDADRDYLLNATNVMSQERLGGTVIYDRSEVFYDARVRLHGSAASRARDGDDYISYDIGFPPDHLFRGVQGSVGIDRAGRSPTARQQDEVYVLHMFQRAKLPVHHADPCYFIAPKTLHTGTAILQLGAYNGLFVTEQFGEDGSVFNLDATYEPSVTVGGLEAPKLPVPLQTQLGTDFADLGNDVNQYREPFDIRFGERADDYSGIIRLCQTMGAPQAEFDMRIAAALDVDEAIRLTALTILCGIGDIYFNANPSFPHNCRIFTPADGGPAQFLPWDMDFVFYHDANESIFPTASYNISKFVNTPATRRLYLAHVNDLLQTVFNTTYMAPWLVHYGSVVGQDYTARATYIQTRRNAALSQLPAPVPFAITSNGGNGFTVDTNFIILAGAGWLDVRGLEVNGIPYTVNWTTITNWSLTLPLGAGANFLTVQAVGLNGDRLANRIDTISVTNTTVPALLPVVINEWMADNVGPGGFADPADGLFQDWFELFNPNPASVNLGGFHLTDNLGNPTKFTIPSNTVIAARGFLLVWADENSSQNLATNSDHLHVNFRLNNDGEVLGLFAPDGLSPQHTVTFGPQFVNVSQGLFPDGAVGTSYFMTNWTPRASNRRGLPPAPDIVSLTSEPGTLHLVVTATPGRRYQLEYKDSLDALTWAPLGSGLTARATSLVFDVNIGPEPQRFLRVRFQ